MQHLKIFIELTRLNKPIGYMLLFWPCAWGLAYALSKNQDLNLFFYYLFLFFLPRIELCDLPYNLKKVSIR